MGNQMMDAILSVHAIEPQYLRVDDFDGFFAAREAALLALIESAMGKLIAREVAQDDSIEDMAQEVNEYQEEELAVV
jgi:hypothetical protein